MNNLIAIIPAFNPPKDILKNYITELKQLAFLKIIIIDDGSDIKYQSLFQELSINKEVIILQNKQNRGKGYSLKKAFSFILKYYLDKCSGVITIDADGQHSLDDVKKLMKYFSEDERVILGVRNFNQKNIPMVRKYSNKLTNFIFFKLYKIKIWDTQSGLRIFPIKLLSDLSSLEGNRYEYELLVLIYLVSNNISIKQIPIETIYYKKKRSFFKPIYDSICIYKIMIKGGKIR